jgi:hypothetical protein
MTSEQQERIHRALWPMGDAPVAGVWAILDCARDPRIYRALLGSRLDFRCLYSGRLPRELEVVAPHLVELLPNNRLTRQLLEEGWGRSWGVLLQIDDPSELRHHLRKYLRVRDEAGRRLLFRYYDPRVLRAYLPTCQADELRQVFGPVKRFLAEGEDGQSLVGWRFDGRRLLPENLVDADHPH